MTLWEPKAEGQHTLYNILTDDTLGLYARKVLSSSILDLCMKRGVSVLRAVTIDGDDCKKVVDHGPGGDDQPHHRSHAGMMPKLALAADLGITFLPTELLPSHQKVRERYEELKQLSWGSKVMEDQANRPHRKPKEKKKHTGGKLRQLTPY